MHLKVRVLLFWRVRWECVEQRETVFDCGWVNLHQSYCTSLFLEQIPSISLTTWHLGCRLGSGLFNVIFYYPLSNQTRGILYLLAAHLPWAVMLTREISLKYLSVIAFLSCVMVKINWQSSVPLGTFHPCLWVCSGTSVVIWGYRHRGNLKTTWSSAGNSLVLQTEA